jgi:hypothetical protein
MHNNDLNHAIQQSARLSDFLHHTLGTKADLDMRGRFAMAYLNLCLDHREAILLLVDAGAFASASALQRPLLEAFVTGAWIDNSATDNEIQNIASFTHPAPSFEKMAQRLRKTHAFGKWFEVLRGYYKILGDYTHGHRRQLSRWIGRDTVEPRYSAEQMAEVLRYADVVGLFAAIHREQVAKRPIARLLETLDAVMLKQEYPGAPTVKAT